MLEFKWQKAVGQNNILDFLTRIKGGMFRYNFKKQRVSTSIVIITKAM